MKVLKFGGTSVGSVNSILSVKKIVEAIEEPVIVVVSALGGITDKLLATSTMASKGDLAYEKELSEIIARHLDVIEGVIEDKEVRMDVQKKVMALLDELSNIFKGVYLINDLSAKTSDTIVSYGERLSSLIVSNVIKDAKLFDSRKYIKTVKQFKRPSRRCPRFPWCPDSSLPARKPERLRTSDEGDRIIPPPSWRPP